MSAGILRILVLGNALLLVLPAGWCCPAPPPRLEKAPPCSCCPPPEPDADDAALPPAPSEPACCCRIDSVPPPPLESPDLTLSLLALAGDAAASPHGIESSPSVAVPVPGPPLQLLHCVWRC